MSFVKAVRQNLILLLGVVGKSGSGKTKSALMLARGLVGPKGRIKAIDSENRRMSYHAEDPLIGDFEVCDLQPPYSPDRYLEQFKLATKDADVLVIDSMSHEWNGEGGCLTMVEKFLDDKAKDDWNKRNAMKMMAWGSVTPKHDLFVAAICRSPIPIICCFRAKDKVVMSEATPAPGFQRGKTTVDIDEDAPVQRKDLVHEMTMIFQLDKEDGVGGFFNVRKRTTEGLYQAFVAAGEKQITVGHGAALAAWCKAPNTPSPSPSGSHQSPQQQPGAAPSTSKAPTVTTRNWMIDQLKDIHVKMQAYGIDKAIIMPTDSLEDWPLDKVPTTKAELTELRKKIEAHQ